MPYWFRAVETFAPWVHKVYFVTWGHLPPFLNTKAPKLEIVKHTDFIPSEYLPSFNSRSIEMNIHRISGLSEHFVYFNDDMFLLQPSVQEHFFHGGLPCAMGCECPDIVYSIPASYKHEHINCMGIINKHFDKRISIQAICLEPVGCICINRIR